MYFFLGGGCYKIVRLNIGLAFPVLLKCYIELLTKRTLEIISWIDEGLYKLLFTSTT